MDTLAAKVLNPREEGIYMGDDVRMGLKSKDIMAERLEQFWALFPEVFTEGKVDCAKLKEALGDDVASGPERYGLSWAGKSEAIKNIQTASVGTLLPAPGQSVDFDTTGNLIIEGDNLEVLKLLQKSYHGKVKMVYIDPPYNTGNEFIYPDNFREGLDDYLKYSGQVDGDGVKLTTNTETDGRFHSKWLSMMYPRLFLSRNLLRDDGVIFVSIDDHEVHNLRALMNEIFGEENFVASVVWKKKYGGGAKTKYYVDLHEYVVCYAKNIATIDNIEIPYDEGLVAKYYKFRDEKYELRGPYRLQPLATNSNDERPNLRYPIVHNGEEIWPEMQWQWSKDRTELAQKNNELVIVTSKGKTSVNFKQYLKDENGEVRTNKPFSIIEGIYTQHGTSEISDILGNGKIFPFPKPTKLIKEILCPFLKSDDIILDFFAGSGSTAHAVLEMNSEDGGNRKFILVQLPEPTEREDYPTIAEITKERVRRVIKKLNEADDAKLDFDGKKQDRGFKVVKLSSSNFKVWDGTKAAEKSEELAVQLQMLVDNVKHDRKPLDMLYEIILKAGLPLTAPVAKVTAAGSEVYMVDGGKLLVCLEESISQDTLREMIGLKPLQVVCLDAAFHGNDMLKTNAVLEMKSHSIGFRTV